MVEHSPEETIMIATMLRWAGTTRTLSLGTLVLTTLISYGFLGFAVLQGWPLWLMALAALTPWAPVFALATRWTATQADLWLALFFVLAITQSGHFLEHVAQMTQIHLLGLQGPQARGVFGALDIEWVHLIWNTWVLLAVLVLLIRFRTNRWLWLAALMAGWHGVEHAYIMSVFLRTGTPGTPGLLSEGGALAGGLPVSRADLHFLYNLAETVPLLIAFAIELRRGLTMRASGGRGAALMPGRPRAWR